MNKGYKFADLNEQEFNDLVVGKAPSYDTSWPLKYRSVSLSHLDGVAAIWKELDDGTACPMAIIAPIQRHRRLFSRFSQLRSDLSPLSAWCHIFESKDFEAVGDVVREPSLGGLDAA